MKSGLIFQPSKHQFLNTRHVLNISESHVPEITPLMCRRAASRMASQLKNDSNPSSSSISRHYFFYFNSHDFRRLNTLPNKLFQRKLASSYHIPVFGDIVRRHKHTGVHVDSDSEDTTRHKELPIVFKNRTKKGTGRAADLTELKRRIKKKPAGAVAIKVISCIDWLMIHVIVNILRGYCTSYTKELQN